MKSFIRRLVSAGPLAALASGALAAENTSPIPSPFRLGAGDRVRITRIGAPKAEPLIGIYRATTAESLEVDPLSPHATTEARLVVPIHEIERIEVSRQRKRHTLAGLLVGLAVGGAVVLVAVSGSNEIATAGVFALPVGGALAGALVGSGFVTERWELVWERRPGP